MSLRRRIFYLLIIVGFLFVIVNIHQRAIWVQQTFRTESRGIIPGMKISSSERSGQKISTATNSNHANNRKDVENEIENETQSICNCDLGNLKFDFIKSLCENSVLNNVNKYIFRKKYH